MTAAVAPRDWEAIDFTSVDRETASHWIAVLPLAATEQHGPHLPLETDVLIADAFLARVRAMLPSDRPAVFLPLQPIGISTEHTDYPGTLTLSPHDALRDWMAWGDKIAHAGVRKLAMVTSHGGNSAAMTMVAQELRAKHGMLAVSTGWHRFGAPADIFPADEIRFGIHGGAVETSILLAHCPQRVRMDRLADFPSDASGMSHEFRWLSAERPAPFAWMAQDLNVSGAVGNAALATAEKGEQLIEHGARAFCDLLADMDAFDMARLRHAPEP